MKAYYFKDTQTETYFTEMENDIDIVWDKLCNAYGTGYTLENIQQVTKEEYYTSDYRDLRDFMWDVLEGHGVSEQSLRIATDIAGYSEETLCKVLDSQFGYKNFFEFLDQ